MNYAAGMDSGAMALVKSVMNPWVQKSLRTSLIFLSFLAYLPCFE
jgi:hypothetical protein